VSGADIQLQCKLNPHDENGACETCNKLAIKSVRLPCIRRKITDIKLFKPGQVQGFEWTRRWKDCIVDNIASWASIEDKIIEVSEGRTSRSVELRVREFVPQEGDKLERSWVFQGYKRSVPIPPYAIVDLDAAQHSYMEYINRGIVECFHTVLDSKGKLLWSTYNLAWKRAQDPAVPDEERSLLVLTLRLWMAVRLRYHGRDESKPRVYSAPAGHGRAVGYDSHPSHTSQTSARDAGYFHPPA
jgi:hypothetical protein